VSGDRGSRSLAFPAEFYWGSAFKLSGAPSFKGLRTARAETSPTEIDNEALICMIMNINDLN
jgi:hypothetical protein